MSRRFPRGAPVVDFALPLCSDRAALLCLFLCAFPLRVLVRVFWRCSLSPVQALYEKYKEMADKEEGVAFVGRLASYKYFNMDQAILNSLEMFDDVVAQGKLKKKE